ncbi:MAG: flavin reductase family protein [Oscillospiraceae bacterium]|nr:flavin reductase family protein [Oscillospiraceae bacterium]
MGKVFWNGGTLLSPVPPAMVSCGTLDKPNIITIGWTGIVNTKPPMTYISVRPERYSYDIIKMSGEFVINLTTSKLVKKADFCGVRTGAKIDKFKKCGLHATPAQKISAPIIEECPLSLECVVKQIIPLGTHDMFLAEIVGADIDERLIDSKGKLNLQQAGLAAYSHGEYFSLGRKLGDFGFSVRKKPRK